MYVSIGLVLAQFVPAFLALDLTFRRIDLAPGSLARELRRFGWYYAVGAAAFSVAGA